MRRPRAKEIKRCLPARPWVLLRACDSCDDADIRSGVKVKVASIVEAFATQAEAEHHRAECIGDYWCLAVWDCRLPGEAPDVPKHYPTWLDGRYQWLNG